MARSDGRTSTSSKDDCTRAILAQMHIGRLVNVTASAICATRQGPAEFRNVRG